jgi:hypothetical protein
MRASVIGISDECRTTAVNCRRRKEGRRVGGGGGVCTSAVETSAKIRQNSDYSVSEGRDGAKFRRFLKSVNAFFKFSTDSERQ